MNTPILTSQNAFSAMMAGKNILCRAVGEMLDFNDLDQFPATIFAQPGYEFCIKIDTIEVAGITFTVPMTLDEVEQGQDVFIINTYGASIYVVDFSCPALTESINNGFVQRDAENAKLQLQAMSKLMGRELPKDLAVVRLGGDKPKTPRKVKAKAPVAESVKVAPVETDSTEITAVSEPTAESNIVTFKDRKDQAEHVKLLREKITAAQSSADLDALLPQIRDVGGEHGHALMVAHVDREDALKAANIEIDTNSEAIFQKFSEQIESLEATEAVIALRYKFSANSHLDRDQVLELSRLSEQRLAALDPEQYQPVDEEEVKRQQLLADLLERATMAKTPAEANALFTYTRNWSEDQRKPLHTAVSKRLTELNTAEPKEVQTLMAQIQRAGDLTTLDILEIDVGARAPDMQKKFMAEVVKRRKALENQESA